MYHVIFIIFQLTSSHKNRRYSLNFSPILKSKCVPETREQALDMMAWQVIFCGIRESIITFSHGLGVIELPILSKGRSNRRYSLNFSPILKSKCFPETREQALDSAGGILQFSAS